MSKRIASVSLRVVALLVMSGSMCSSEPATYDVVATLAFGRLLDELTTQTVTLETPPAPPRHPMAGAPAGEVRPSTSLKNVGAAHVTLTEADTRHAGLGCGTHERHRVLCASQAALPAGIYVMLWEEAEGFALAQETALDLQYGFVLDRPGVPNYEPSQFPLDFFFGTDFWLTVARKAGEQPVVKAQDATGGTITEATASVRVIVTGDRIIALVPAAQVPGAGPLRYRITIHEHTGDFGREQPWSGVTEPDVGEPLRAVTDACAATYVCGELTVTLEYGAGPGECILRVADPAASFMMVSGLLQTTDASGSYVGSYTTREGGLTSLDIENQSRTCVRQP